MARRPIRNPYPDMRMFKPVQQTRKGGFNKAFKPRVAKSSGTTSGAMVNIQRQAPTKAELARRMAGGKYRVRVAGKGSYYCGKGTDDAMLAMGAAKYLKALDGREWIVTG